MPTLPRFPTMGQGPSVPVVPNSEEAELDELGFTNPNLHRRIDPQDPVDLDAVSPNSYSIGIYGKHSYRTVTIHVHDEDSTSSEIP